MPRKCTACCAAIALFQRARIGQADVLDRHAHQAAGEIQAVFAGFEHARQPVERRVGVGGTHALVQGGNQVEVLFAALVVEQHLAAEHGLDRGGLQHAIVRHGGSQFQKL